MDAIYIKLGYSLVPVPCPREGDTQGCDHCWCAGNSDAEPYCSSFEYRKARAPFVIAHGREWLSWCGQWKLGPFPPDYQRRIEAQEAEWLRRTGA